jgi:glucose/arabinose dehydrogenase
VTIPRLALVALLALLPACRGDGGDADVGSGATTPTSAPGDGGGGAGGTGAPGDGGSSGPGPQATPAPSPPDVSRARAQLVEVASVTQPTAMAVRPNDDAIYVAEKTGRVRRVPRGQTPNPAAPEATAVLDLAGQVSLGSEQGLLGLTFSPDGSKLYVDYTDRAGDTRVVEYQFRDGRADPDTRRELLFVEQPFVNHNGGQILFGPDGKFYIALGDGGSRNDPDNRAQNLNDLLGKILRIDPQPSGGTPYTIPSDNPFVGRSGARPEIWMYGLRNPWRFTWDRQTKDLWIADVGQNRLEEIDFLAAGSPAGANFGWSLLEGTARVKGSNPEGGILPIFEYGRDDGCSITGGYVYRGARVPSLRGVYVYGDACTGNVWGLTQAGGEVTGQGQLDLRGLEEATATSGFNIASFGEDAAGELYLLSLGGGVYRFEPL